MKRPTSKDVARLAGVSQTTVSFVLNNVPHARIPEETRVRVLKAVETLDYHPNSNARGLRTRTNRTVGLILPDITNPFHTQMARGVEDGAAARGYAVIFGNSDDSLTKEEAYINLFREKCVDGFLLAPARNERYHVRRLSSLGLPHVIIDQMSQSATLSSVSLDNEAIARLVMAHLIDLGHRAIALVDGPAHNPNFRDILNGYKRSLRERGLAVRKEYVLHTRVTLEDGYQATQELLRLPDPPTAIFGGADMIAIGCLQAALNAGLRVPDDISIAGIDDIPLSRFLSVPLTTVSSPKYQIGLTGVQLLIDMIEQRPSFKPGRIVLPVELVIRKSTGRAPARWIFSSELAPALVQR